MPAPALVSPPISCGPKLTTPQAAELIGCAPATLELDRIRHRWRVPFLKIGRLVRYDRDAVLAWLASQQNQP